MSINVHPNIQPIISYPLLKYWEQLQLFEPIYHVRAGFRYTVIVGTHPVTKKSCVLATGSNLYNCINGTYWNDSNPNIQVPGRVFHIAALDGESIAKISSGYGDVIYLTTDGKVFGAGYSYHGECGTGSAEEVTQVRQIPFFEGKIVKDVNCGTFHTVFLVQEASGLVLYVCGRNEERQLSTIITTISPSRFLTSHNMLTPHPIPFSMLCEQIGSSILCTQLQCAVGGGRCTFLIFQNNQIALSGKLYTSPEIGNRQFTSLQVLDQFPNLHFYDLERASCGDSHFLAVFQRKKSLIPDRLWKEPFHEKSNVFSDVQFLFSQ